jgi:hypothetical protein
VYSSLPLWASLTRITEGGNVVRKKERKKERKNKRKKERKM